MSLLVWLPLDGDLRNLGASNVEAVNNGATVDNAGKIGKCYYFDGNGHYLQLSESVGNLYSSDFSWAVWLKPTDSTRSIISSEYASTGSSNVAFELTASRGIRIYWNGSPDIYPTNSTLPINTWTHVAITKTTGTIKTYLNGELKYTYTGTLSDKSSTSKIRIGDDYRGGTSVSYMGYMNDWRLYNHCLSAAEVHEIAMGLVLHYKLDGGVTTAKNLIKNGYGELDATNWSNSANFSSEVPPNYPEIKKSIYNNTTVEYIPIESTHSYKLEVYLKNSATSGNTYPSLYPYDIDKKFITTNNCQEGFILSTMTTLTQQLKSGDTKIYVNSLANWNANSGHYHNAAAIFSYKDSTGHLYPDGTYTQNVPRFGNGTNAKTNLDKTNNIITLNSAYTGPTMPIGTSICAATDGNTYYYPFGGLTKSSLNNWTYKTATMIPNNIARLKYAKYIRYSIYDGTLHAGIKLIDLTDDIDSTIVSDSSGYEHNGTINGTLTVSSNAVKYSSCVYMPKTTTIIHPRPIYGGTDQEWTCCMWVKLDTTSQSGQQMNNFNSGNIIQAANGKPLLYLNSGSNDYYNYGNLAVSAEVWTHIAFVFKNSNATKLIYINGENHTNTSGPNKTSTPSGIQDIVTVGYNLAGYIVDYRIYCTPLLDNDIKMLYNVGMRVDNLGGVHTFELNEYSNNKIASVQVVNNSATSFTFDKITNTYTITSPVGTSSWGYGLRFADTPADLIVPYGYSYRWSCDIFTPIAATFISDYNNTPISGSAWAGNDNDLTSQRLSYSISIPANTWTTIILGSSNTHASNTSHISIRDYSSMGMITNGMSEPLVWKIRNLKWYLVEKEPINSVNKKGQVISNFYNEDSVKKTASISNKSKSFSATEFIEI